MKNYGDRGRCYQLRPIRQRWITACYFENDCREKCLRHNPERYCDQYTVPDTVAVETTFVAFL